MIRLVGDDPMRQAIDELAQRLGSPAGPGIQVQTSRLALELVRRGMGWTVVDFLTASRLDPTHMVTVELPDLPPMSLYSYHASHHPQTGLLNTRALAEALDECGEGYTVAFIQLRGLRLISDALGNDIGDAVLQSMATRLGGLGARCGTLAFQPAEDFVFAIGSEHDTQRVLDDLHYEPLAGAPHHPQPRPETAHG